MRSGSGIGNSSCERRKQLCGFRSERLTTRPFSAPSIEHVERVLDQDYFVHSTTRLSARRSLLRSSTDAMLGIFSLFAQSACLILINPVVSSRSTSEL